MRNFFGLLLGLSIGCLPNVSAQLPTLDDAPWLGYFAGYENKRFTFGLTAAGEIKVTPLNDKRDPFGPNDHFAILFGIEEVLPDGKSEMKKIKAESLTSEQAATDTLEKIVIRGKVSADAGFEAVIQQDRGVITINGRVTETGSFKKNPIRFGVEVKFPDTYPKWMREEKWKSDQKAMAALQKKLALDTIKLTWTDGKRMTQSFEEPVDVLSKKLNGPGISKAEVETGTYKNLIFIFSASKPSALTISNKGSAPLCDGFSIHWTPDLDGKAAFSFEMK